MHKNNFEFDSDMVFSPVEEISAYEALWDHATSVKQVADLFRSYKHALPSSIAKNIGVSEDTLESFKYKLANIMPFHEYGAIFFNDFEYPERLRDARNPVEVLYYKGNLSLLSSPCISIVGARKASEDGIKRTRKLVRLLVKENFTIMSGLAEGIDRAAHQEAIKADGRTIGVLGTPLNQSYPKVNNKLQNYIAQKFLIISQVPFGRSSLVNITNNRMFFPERNKTMSALSAATIIVEASDTSGSLTQARAAIEQGRMLMILNSCFEKKLKWPERFLALGAIRIKDENDILKHLSNQ